MDGITIPCMFLRKTASSLHSSSGSTSPPLPKLLLPSSISLTPAYMTASKRSSLATLPAKPLRLKLAESFLRSEEHTSELQSRSDIVCRLLLEKKKHNDSI